jgi:hypothetical protein
VPRIPDGFLQTAIYLYRSESDATNGSDLGGSGFLAGFVEANNTVRSHYATTNAHVVSDGFRFIRINTIDGAHDIVETSEGDWTLHPEGDDVAVCAFSPKSHRDYKYALSRMFITEELISEYNVGPGDEVFMVGRCVGHGGSAKNLPVARFGNIAMLPSEKIRNALGKERPHFLVEVRSVSGFSGSPVFVYDAPGSVMKGARHSILPDMLLGIDCGHLAEHEEHISAGMAAVVPAWRLLELINRAEATAHRNVSPRRNHSQ